MIQELLKRLTDIEQELEAIGSSNADMFKSYTGTSFPEQQQLAENVLDNLILAATHETATTIGFYRKDIETVCTFIVFRSQYKELTDDELCRIIDDIDCNIQFRAALKKKLSSENLSECLSNLRNEWNEQFSNESYCAIRSLIYKNIISARDTKTNPAV
jgi:hypothetical protein